VAKLIALYKEPADPQAFDDYYFGTHIPIARKIPELREFLVSEGGVGTPQGPSPYHLAALLTFDDMTALQQSLASAEGQAAVADLANFAAAGVDILVFDTKEA
jgi:uncharacterized protein (TIGR02118 family)